MSDDLETRTYNISGELSVKQWRGVESFLGRLGVGFRQYPPEEVADGPEAILSPESITRGTFRNLAVSRGFQSNAATRAWNQLAYLYFWREFSWHSTPEPFRDILEYETVLDSTPGYGAIGDRVDGLKPQSLERMMTVVDRAIYEAGSVYKAVLPHGFGAYTIDQLRVVSAESRMTNA